MAHRQLHIHALRARKPLSILGGLLCFCTAAVLTQTSAQAQTLYRIVGPDGRVTFSDKPPAASAKVTPLSADGKDVGNAASALPYELRQVAAKYPVTLFSSKECMPCDEGRTLLRSRGIPFTEKTVESNDDAESLKRLANTGSVPLLTVGGQQIKGYSAPEWTQYLNAAGYPEKSKLPAGYRYAEPSPLVAAKPTESAPSAAKAPEAPARTSAPAPAAATRVSPSNPAGIQF
ncbi:glutaredoxin family protein [Rhodoferax sp. U11-2br]|nr:glutaredoxin family protein [Rhodoferax sp. U11-2br]